MWEQAASRTIQRRATLSSVAARIADWTDARTDHAGAGTFLVAVIPAAAVAMAATLTGAWDRFGHDGSTHHLVHSPEFKFWIFLLTAQTALWLICFLLLWQITRTLRHHMEGASRREVRSVFLAFSVPIVLSVGVVPISTGLHYPLPHHQLRVFGLSAIGAAVAMVGGLGLGRIHAQLGACLPASATPDLAIVERYLDLRRSLQRILVIEGAMIGAAVLATGGLRNAVLAYSAGPGAHAVNFPREFVLMAGIFYSAVLALVYSRRTGA
jgi:hypothetical protein